MVLSLKSFLAKNMFKAFKPAFYRKVPCGMQKQAFVAVLVGHKSIYLANQLQLPWLKPIYTKRLIIIF